MLLRKVLPVEVLLMLMHQRPSAAPGGEIPPHLHGDVEELYLIEGGSIIDGVAMCPGDYCRAEANSRHGATRSPGGCVFLVISSGRDRPLAE